MGRSITPPDFTCCGNRPVPGRSGAPTARYADLTRGNPILEVLGHFCGIDRRRIDLDREFSIDEVTDVRWRALPVASKPAPYSPNRESPVPGDNVALVIEDRLTGRSAVYAPGLGGHR